MAVQNWGVDLSFLAAVDMTTWQYKLVESASGQTGYVSKVYKDSGSILGVLQNEPRAGEEATVRVYGTTKLIGISDISGGCPIKYCSWLQSTSAGLATGVEGFSASGVLVGFSLDAYTVSESAAATASAIIEAFILPYMLRIY